MHRGGAEGSVAGVDVGGPRKGFHAALLRGGRLELYAHTDPVAVVSWLAGREPAPRVVAVDCPPRPAPDGLALRPEEAAFARARVCGIRWTPSRDRVDASDYYSWTRNGFALHAELEARSAAAGWQVVECFPTATFTLAHGPRGGRSRTAWTRAAVAAWDLDGAVPRNQDERDAVAAAWTAMRCHDDRPDRPTVRRFGSLVVPWPPAEPV